MKMKPLSRLVIGTVFLACTASQYLCQKKSQQQSGAWRACGKLPGEERHFWGTDHSWGCQTLHQHQVSHETNSINSVQCGGPPMLFAQLDLQDIDAKPFDQPFCPRSSHGNFTVKGISPNATPQATVIEGPDHAPISLLRWKCECDDHTGQKCSYKRGEVVVSNVPVFYEFRGFVPNATTLTAQNRLQTIKKMELLYAEHQAARSMDSDLHLGEFNKVSNQTASHGEACLKVPLIPGLPEEESGKSFHLCWNECLQQNQLGKNKRHAKQTMQKCESKDQTYDNKFCMSPIKIEDGKCSNMITLLEKDAPLMKGMVANISLELQNMCKQRGGATKDRGYTFAPIGRAQEKEMRNKGEFWRKFGLSGHTAELFRNNEIGVISLNEGDVMGGSRKAEDGRAWFVYQLLNCNNTFKGYMLNKPVYGEKCSDLRSRFCFKASPTELGLSAPTKNKYEKTKTETGGPGQNEKEFLIDVTNNERNEEQISGEFLITNNEVDNIVRKHFAKVRFEMAIKAESAAG